MTLEKPDFLKSGEAARLIPVVAETSREQRAASVLLAVMMAVPELADRLLSTAGRPVGKSARVECWTETVFANQPDSAKDRPDGLIVVRRGANRWSALVEAKIGGAELDPEQVERYAELARASAVDAVITISNQFVARADHHPVRLRKALARKVGLYHWSWMRVLTEATLLDTDHAVNDRERAFLLDEAIRFLSHDSTGVSGFGQMGKCWKDVVATVRNGGKLSRSAAEVESAVASWQQEERDLCLIMCRHLGSVVDLKMNRHERDDPDARLKEGCRRLAEEFRVVTELQIPGAATDLEIVGDLQTRTVCCAMELKAPEDKKSTKARVSWLLRQLSKSTDPDIHIRARWPGRTPDTMQPLALLREDPARLQTHASPKATPLYLQVRMVKDIAGRFSGSRTFIEEIERAVPLFYDEVGQHLRAWQPTPPKPRRFDTVTAEQDGGDIEHQAQTAES